MTSPGSVVPGAPEEELIPGLPNPKLPLKLAFGDDYPEPGEKGAAIRFLENRVQETQAEALARYRQAVLCTLYFGSLQYVTWNRRRNEYEESPLEAHEIRVTYNLIRTIVRSRIQRILSPKVVFTAVPKSNSMEDRDKVRVAADWLNSRWRANGMDDLMTGGMQLAMVAGSCALKGFWNSASGPLRTAMMQFPQMEPMVDPETGAPLLDQNGEPLSSQVMGPDGAPVYDELPVNVAGEPVEDPADAHRFRPGDTGTGIRTIFNIRVNPGATGFTAEEGFRWLIDEEMVNVASARRKWPEHASEIKEHGSLPSLTYERMARSAETQRPASGALGAISSATGSANKEQNTLQREYWQLPDDDYFPEGRLIVQIGQVEVYDGPYPQGVFPYTILYDEPGMFTPLGRPSTSDLISLQDTLNRECTAIAQEMHDSGMGQFVAWDIPDVPDQLSRESRQIVKIPMRTALAGKSISDVFQRLDPASVGSDRWRIIELMERAMYNVGAYHEVTRGSVPPGVESGVAIKSLIEQDQGQLAIAFRASRNTILQWGRVQLALAKWGYGDEEERFIPVERPDLGFQIEGVRGAELPDPETIELDLDNYRPTSQAENEAEVKWAFENGLIDGRSALDALDMGRGLNSTFTSQTRHYARARSENLKIQRGEFVVQQGPPAMAPEGDEGAEAPEGPGQSILFNIDGSPFFLGVQDDHMAHHLVHQEIILDDTQPWLTRQVMMAHDELHLQAIAAQAAAQAAAAQAPPGGGGETPPPAQEGA